MPTILQINSVLNKGSTGRIVENIGKIAIGLNWNSYIAYNRGGGPSFSKKIKIGNRLSFLIHVLITRIFDLHGLASYRATNNFIKRIKKIKPDVIHLHNIHGYFLHYGLLFQYLNESNVPVIWTLHDCWAFTGHCAYFDFVGCTKWKEGCFDCPLKMEYPKSYLIDRSKKNFLQKKYYFSLLNNLTLIPVSAWMADLVSYSFLGIHPKVVIYNGIDLGIFRKIQTINRHNVKHIQKDQGKFVILGVANVWDRRKGLEDFVKLSRILSADFEIILVGVGENQRKQIPKSITCISRTSNLEELVALYNIADVYLNLTNEDNYPTTNLESLACGTPVITYDTGGSAESLDINTGIVVPKGCINSVVDAIRIIKEIGKSNFSDNCIRKARATFNMENKFKEYLNLYHSILNRN